MFTLLLLVRATYMYGVILHAHPVRGESHNQRNTTGVVATLPAKLQNALFPPTCIPCLLCVNVVGYSFINFICVPHLLQMSIGYVMHYIFHQLSQIQSAWQGHGVLI